MVEVCRQPVLFVCACQPIPGTIKDGWWRDTGNTYRLCFHSLHAWFPCLHSLRHACLSQFPLHLVIVCCKCMMGAYTHKQVPHMAWIPI